MITIPSVGHPTSEVATAIEHLNAALRQWENDHTQAIRFVVVGYVDFLALIHTMTHFAFNRMPTSEEMGIVEAECCGVKFYRSDSVETGIMVVAK